MCLSLQNIILICPKLKILTLHKLINKEIDVSLVTVDECIDGAHSIDVQNVTSNCKVSTLISFFSLYLARRLASGETFIRW